jgi:hypothetical protein
MFSLLSRRKPLEISNIGADRRAPISRRRVLRTGALLVGAGAAGLALPAAAGAKTSQAAAGYKTSPSGGKECDKCQSFQPPSACKVVEGTVSPTGSCNFFAPMSK